MLRIQHTTVVNTPAHQHFIWTYINVIWFDERFAYQRLRFWRKERFKNLIKWHMYTFVSCLRIWFVNVTSIVITVFYSRAENWYPKTSSKVCKIRNLLDNTKSAHFVTKCKVNNLPIAVTRLSTPWLRCDSPIIRITCRDKWKGLAFSNNL